MQQVPQVALITFGDKIAEAGGIAYLYEPSMPNVLSFLTAAIYVVAIVCKTLDNYLRVAIILTQLAAQLVLIDLHLITD